MTDPNQDAAPDLTDADGPALAAQDEEFVTGLLGELGSAEPALPAAVAAQWEAALAAEAQARAGELTSASAARVGILTPIPHQRSADQPVHPSGRLNPLRYAGWLAGAAAVALLGGVVVSQASTDPSQTGDAPAVAAPTQRTAAPLPTASGVTTSGVSYTPQNVPAEVTGLVRAGQRPATLPATVDADPHAGSVGEEATTGTGAAGEFASTDSSTDSLAEAQPPTQALSLNSAPLTAFREDAAQRRGCVAELADGEDVHTVAFDVGYFQDRPAVLVVLSFPASARMLDAYIVDPDCDADQATIRYFARVNAP